MISNELLSLILGINVQSIEDDENELEYSFSVPNDFQYRIINKDTLSRKCKEWCLKQGYHLIEYVNGVEIIERSGCKKIKTIQNVKDFNSETIIKATEWVYNETN